MRYVVAVLALVVLVGCGVRAPVATAPTSAPVAIGTAAPATAMLTTTDTKALATLVSAATLADGSLAQTDSLHTAYLAGTPSLLTIDAGRTAQIQMLGSTLAPLLVGEDRIPVTWRCADGLTINAVYLAMATAGQVTDDAAKDRTYRQDANATHVVAQAALLTAQRVAHRQPTVPLSPDVLAANRSVAMAYGHQVTCP